MDFKIQFKNPQQEEFFFLKQRNQCFSGGFNNGKTFDACLKVFFLISKFRKYRVLVARQYAKDLRETTMKTFFKICPEEYIESHNRQEGITTFKNGSEILWMHLDECDEQSLRGLEINSALVDQGEEISESIYLILDSRIGRWDQAIVPPELLTPAWPLTPLGKPKVPTYMMILCNPDTMYHWIYRRYHPDSLERLNNHIMVQGATDPNLGDPETIKQMLTRDPSWIKKYYNGEWGVSESQIHIINSDSLLDYSPSLLELIQSKATLFRVLDHGESAPTCCLWIAVLNSSYIVYREYYMPNSLISCHRKYITELSKDEEYFANYADPSIFKQTSKTLGGTWKVSDEYFTSDLDAPPLYWIPADNNEIATRNRINELLTPNSNRKHPFTDTTPAPGIYFIKRSREYPNGCFYAIKETQSQQRVKIGNVNGLDVYSDEREKSISDHAYDCVRYFISMHGTAKQVPKRTPPRRSFAFYNRIRQKIKHEEPLYA
jgi:hypothetical protein